MLQPLLPKGLWQSRPGCPSPWPLPPSAQLLPSMQGVKGEVPAREKPLAVISKSPNSTAFREEGSPFLWGQIKPPMRRGADLGRTHKCRSQERPQQKEFGWANGCSCLLPHQPPDISRKVKIKKKKRGEKRHEAPCCADVGGQPHFLCPGRGVSCSPDREKLNHTEQLPSILALLTIK